MNFQLDEEQEFVRKMVREFATNEVEPLAADIDQEHRFPTKLWRKMAKYGMLGVPFPTEYGGAGGDHISYAITVEELSESVLQQALSALLTLPCAAGLSSTGAMKNRRKNTCLICYPAKSWALSV